MVGCVENELRIEELKTQTPETVDSLRGLLNSGANFVPDPKRANLYEVEDASNVYYVHISPVSGKVLLLATWAKEAA